MNILLINHYAGSPHYGMEYRPYYLSRNWVAQGHRVTVLAASQSHLRLHSPQFDGLIGSETIDGIHYIWLRTPPYRGNGIRRVVNIFAFVVALLRHCRHFLTPCADVVVASSTYPFDVFPAYVLSRLCRARLVFEVHDLWPLTPLELGHFSRWHPFILFLQVAEDFACRCADRVISILPRADKHLRTRGMAQQKYFHVPNGINAAEWKQATAPLPEAHVRSILRARDRQHFLVGYAGYHGTANALEVLLDAAEHVRERPVTFLLVGKGPLKAQLVSLAAERGLANVEFLPPIEKSSIPALLAAMDALFIGWRNSPLYRFGVSPNKLFDYMMAQRPVIHSVTTTDDVVANAGCGISCAAEDPQGIADAITFLSSQSQSSLRAMGERGRQYVLDHHEYSVLAQDFLKAVA